jgi:hypothetical protein
MRVKRKKKEAKKKEKQPDGKVENTTQWSELEYLLQVFPTFPQARLRRRINNQQDDNF